MGPAALTVVFDLERLNVVVVQENLNVVFLVKCPIAAICYKTQQCALRQVSVDNSFITFKEIVLVLILLNQEFYNQVSQ